MIDALLPQYHVLFGTDPTYTIVRSIVVDGHETAWMEISGQGYVVRQAYCECYFKEGFGWKRDESGNAKRWITDRCLPHWEAQKVRQAELREELSAIIGDIPVVIDALIAKVEAGEWVENGSGASFYGGWFYLQTLIAIVGEWRVPDVWQAIDRLNGEKRFGLNGMILCPYAEPPPPAWTEAFTLLVDGWIGIASVPTHEHMPHAWQLEVFRPDGTHAVTASERLRHPVMFGIDVEDDENGERRLREIIAKEAKRKSKRS